MMIDSPVRDGPSRILPPRDWRTYPDDARVVVMTMWSLGKAVIPLAGYDPNSSTCSGPAHSHRDDEASWGARASSVRTWEMVEPRRLAGSLRFLATVTVLPLTVPPSMPRPRVIRQPRRYTALARFSDQRPKCRPGCPSGGGSRKFQAFSTPLTNATSEAGSSRYRPVSAPDARATPLATNSSMTTT